MTKVPQNGGGAAARKAGAHKPAAATAFFLQADLAECPLCVEPLDDTDRDFWPCPCGYQVCLFCYQRLQSEYNNTCPGCRQQYSDDLEGVRQHIARKQKQQQAEAVQARHGPPAHHHHQPQQHQGGRVGKAAAGATEQRAHHDLHPRAPDTPSNSGLPLTANWVAAAGAEQQQHHHQHQHHQHHQQQQQHQHAAPAARDDSAWPTLGAAQQQQQQQQHATSGHERRRSSSSSLTTTSLQQQHHQQHHQQHTAQANGHQSGRSSFESIASTPTSTLHASEQHQQRQQDSGRDPASAASAPAHHSDLSRSGSGYTPVEVTTVVGGKRCSVCVPVSGHDPQVEPLPEAASLLGMLQQAVCSSKLTSTEAAVQLVQCLRKLDVDSNGRQAGHSFLQQVLASSRNGGVLPASGRAPPGFAHLMRSGGDHQQQQSQQGETPQSSMHSVDSSSSLFSAGSSLSQSVWTDSGLPGVDLGVSRLSVGLSNGNFSTGLSARLTPHWAGSSAGNGGGGPSASLAGPPPGFGAAAAGTAGLAGARLYNPLAAAAANGNGSSLGLPPGFGVGPAGTTAVQPGAYRPFA